MGREGSKSSVVVAGRSRRVLASETRRALKVAGTGALAGAAAGVAVGGSIGIAALGTAVGAPLIAVGAAVGIGVASIWNLFFGGDHKRARLIQDELSQAPVETLALRQPLHGARQELLFVYSENERLNAEMEKLLMKVEAGEEMTGALTGHQEAPTGVRAACWAGMTPTGSIMVFDPSCQLSSGQFVMLFLPEISDYRVFDKNWIRPRLTRLTGDERDRHTSAYREWLNLPTSSDIQKIAIARLVERSFPKPKRSRQP